MKKNKLLVLLLILGYVDLKAQKMAQILPAKKLEYHLNYDSFVPSTHEHLAVYYSKKIYNYLPLVQPIKSAIKYESFFCNMEIKNLQRFNLWIKFHAGDYDNYTKPNF